MINPELLNLDGSFDLPAFLLGEVYGPIQVEGQHISWSLADSLSLADDLLREDGIVADPQEIYEIMMEFDAQDKTTHSCEMEKEDIAMKDTRKNTLSFETCMDILDWFNDDTHDYITHILLAKLDGEERIRRAMPSISEYCLKLVAAHSAGEDAYPQAV